MTLEKTLLLGFIAGVTILLGLPIARLKRPVPQLRMMLNAVAVGILIFLVWDVLSAAWEPIDTALSDFHEGNGGLARATGYGALFVGALAVGLLSMIAYEHWMARKTRLPEASVLDALESPPSSASSSSSSSSSSTLTLAPPRQGLA